MEVLSWTGISILLSELGRRLTGAFSSLGPSISSAAGYTLALCHPSISSIAARKIQKRDGVGMAEYFQAATAADLPAVPVFFSLLSGILASGGSQTLGAGQAAVAALTSSVAAFAVWTMAFAPYWSRIIRHGKAHGSAKDFLKSFSRPFGEEAPGSGYDEAGRIAGIGLYVWAIPWYMVRAASAAVIAAAGVSAGDFITVFLATITALGQMGSVLTGIKNTLVERVIKQANET